MKKQRWKFTKGKNWLCDKCGDFTKVPKNHQEEICCDGYLCGCGGYPINKVICKKCYKALNRKFMSMRAKYYAQQHCSN